MRALFKAVLSIGLAFSLWQPLLAQQVPLFNQYFTQPSLAFPSASVFSNDPSLGAFYRSQWSGLEGTPVNFALNYTNPGKGKLGFDLNVNRFEVGVIQQTYMTVAAAYGFELNSEHRFSIGAKAGISLLSINESRVSLESLNDDLIQDLLGNNGTVFSVDLGLSYRYKSLSFDMAAPGLFRSSLSDNAFDELSNSNLADYIFTLGYRLLIDPVNQIYIRPNLTWRHQEIIGGNFDLAAQVEFKNKFQASVGYRENFGATAGIGLKINSNVLFTYQYDFGKSDVPFLSDGFNEIGLQLSFAKPENDKEDLLLKGLEVIERLKREEIYDEKLIAAEDKQAALTYLESLESGKKKLRKQQAEAAFQGILDEIREKGFARMKAEAAERLRKENVRKQNALEAQRAQELAKEAALLEEKERQARAEAERKKAQELAKKASKNDTLKGKYLVVVAAYYPDSKWSDAYLSQLKQEYKEAGRFENKLRGYDYLYVLVYDDFEEAVSTMRALRANDKFKDAWVFNVLNEQ